MPFCAPLCWADKRGNYGFSTSTARFSGIFVSTQFLRQVKHIKASLLRSECWATSASREGQEGWPLHSGLAPLPCYPSDPSRSLILPLQLFLLCPQLKGINFYRAWKWQGQPMRPVLIIMGSEASCYGFHTSQPTRVRSSQEVLIFLSRREAIKPHIRGKEYDGDRWRQGESNRSGVWARHLGPVYMGNVHSRQLSWSDFWIERCHWVLGYPKTWENLIQTQNKSSPSEVHGTVQLCLIRTWVLRRSSWAGNLGSEQFSSVFRGTPVLVLVEISLCMDTYK